MTLIDAWKAATEEEEVNRVSTPYLQPIVKKKGIPFSNILLFFMNYYAMGDDDLLADDWRVGNNV